MKARCQQRRASPPLGLLSMVLSCGATGCALVPGVPAGPIGGPGVRVGASYAYAYSPDTVQTLKLSGEPYTVRSNGSMHGAGLVPIFPLRAMVRASPARFIDFGGDLGWIDGGLQLRAGPLDVRRRLPWGVELEWRKGHDAGERLLAYGMRVEIYPALDSYLGSLALNGVLTLGVSTGTRLHEVGVPPRYDQTMEWGRAAFDVTRRETRVELFVGAHGRGERVAFTLALAPWLVVEHGHESGATCNPCTLEFESLSSSWGLALVASGSLFWEMRD